MKKSNSHAGGFTLIEVVISLAVVALALVSILGLIAVFLTGNKDAVDRQEALEVCQPLNNYLQNQGFDTVYKWLQQPTNIPLIYAFNVPLNQQGVPTAPPGGAPGVYVISSADTANYPNLSTYYGYSTGRLYYVSMSVSTNVPYHIGVAQTPTFYTSSLPAFDVSSGPMDATFFADAAISISVRVYAVPPPPFIIQSAALLQTTNHIYPILTYDTTINR